MKKAKELSKLIIDRVNDYTNNYMTEEGKNTNTAASLTELNEIIEKGFVLDKYLVEKGYTNKYPVLAGICLELQKYIDKLNTSEENAKRLSMDSALQIWQQAKVVIAFLASAVLDISEKE